MQISAADIQVRTHRLLQYMALHRKHAPVLSAAACVLQQAGQTPAGASRIK